MSLDAAQQVMVDRALAGAADEARADRALGFWLYLMSDAVIFALLFVTYAVMAGRTAGGPTGADLFDLAHTFEETLILLASSMSFGFASVTAAGRKRGGTLVWLGVTALLGALFLGLELSEFAGMTGKGAGPDRSGFLSAFFTLVGTHGLHVFAGLLGIVVMAVQIGVRGLTPHVHSRLNRLGLFWHFLDLIWVAIFSFVYLAGLA